MATEHDSITDPEIHEPKGVAAAAEGATYHADSGTSGEWLTVGYGCGGLSDDGTANTISSSFVAMNAANFPAGTLVWVENQAGNGISLDTTNGCFECTNPGIYSVHYNLSFSSDDAATAEYQTTIGVDVGSGIVTKEAQTTAYRATTDANVTGFIAGNCLPTLVDGAKVYLMIRQNSGTADIQIEGGNFVISRVL